LIGIKDVPWAGSALAWGLALVAPQHSGKVIAWIGTAMYAAFAVGAPVGTAFYAAHGFFAIAVATAVVPLAVVSVHPLGFAPFPRFREASLRS
jgi:predicted MFS family arabinose efflux permease